MPRYRKRASDEDDATPEGVFSDFVSVENRREEPFPEEFAEGPYGASPREGEDEDEDEGGGVGRGPGGRPTGHRPPPAN